MKLIIRADDLGFSEAVNLGILKSVKDGLINSVGIMPNIVYAEHGYSLIKDENIALGQHTNICAGKPLTDPKLIPSLEGHAVFSENFFTALKNVAKRHNLFYCIPGLDKKWEEENGIYGLGFMKLTPDNMYNPKEYYTECMDKIKSHPCSVAIFHPGYLDNYILTHSSFTHIRAMEYEFLCSEWLKNFIKDNKIELVDFRNYK